MIKREVFLYMRKTEPAKKKNQKVWFEESYYGKPNYIPDLLYRFLKSFKFFIITFSLLNPNEQSRVPPLKKLPFLTISFVCFAQFLFTQLFFKGRSNIFWEQYQKTISFQTRWLFDWLWFLLIESPMILGFRVCDFIARLKLLLVLIQLKLFVGSKPILNSTWSFPFSIKIVVLVLYNLARNLSLQCTKHY